MKVLINTDNTQSSLLETYDLTTWCKWQLKLTYVHILLYIIWYRQHQEMIHVRCKQKHITICWFESLPVCRTSRQCYQSVID